MTTQAPPASQDLAAARELLEKLDAATRGAESDSQTTAITAAAHAVLVLAEQVAAIRVLIVGDAMSRRADAQPAPQNTNARQPAPQGTNARQPGPQDTDGRQSAAQGKHSRRRRGWW